MSASWRSYSDAQWGRLAIGLSPHSTSAMPRRVREARSAIFLMAASVAGAAAFLTRSGAVCSASSKPPIQEIGMREFAVIPVAALVSAAAAAVGENLLVNGGLEGLSGSCSQSLIYANSTAIPGWVVSGAWPIDWMCIAEGSGCCEAFQGSCYVDLNGSPNYVSGSAIRQTVVTVPGMRYRLRLRAVPNDYATTIGTVKTLRLTTGSKVTDFPLVTSPIECPEQMVMGLVEVEFVATATSSEIELRSTYPNSAGGIFVDDVDLRAIPCHGDVDGSTSVDAIDLAIVLQNWGAPNPKYPEADANGDGAVDGADLAVVLFGWGDCP